MDKSKFNIDKLVRKNVLNLKPYSSARDEFREVDRDMVFLDANENPFNNGVNRYPDPQQRDLKEVLARLKGLEISNILLGNGSDEVLDLIFRAFCIPGMDNVITLPPTYGMYGVLAGTNDIENRKILLTDEFQPDVEAIMKAIDGNTKLLFLCSPNNPTANSFEATKIESLVRNFNGLVVIDEAYIDFSPEESWLKRLGEFPNLIITQTLSKAYGMAGIRLGMCFASPRIIAILNTIKPPYNVNILTQHKALERVTDQVKVRKEIDRILQAREKLFEALNQISFVHRIYPSNANFILIKVDDAALRYEQLIEQSIVVRNRSSQPLCSNTLRLTIGTEEENRKLTGALITLDVNLSKKENQIQ